MQDRMIEVGNMNVNVNAFKKSEDGKSWVLRLNEKSGDHYACKIRFS